MEIELRLDDLGRTFPSRLASWWRRACLGCYWWLGPKSSLRRKVRLRTNEGKVVKSPVTVYIGVPSIKLAASNFHLFEGKVVVSDFDTEMDSHM